MKRFWIRFWAGDGSDMRPLSGSPPCEWWCTGERGRVPAHSICALIDAETEEAAVASLRVEWPEMALDSADEREADWRPSADRFPPRKGLLSPEIENHG